MYVYKKQETNLIPRRATPTACRRTSREASPLVLRASNNNDDNNNNDNNNDNANDNNDNDNNNVMM